MTAAGGEFGHEPSCGYEPVAKIAEIEAALDERRLLGQANYLLARIVAAANAGAIDGDDGFIASYKLPVGPIHKAIPFLQQQGIHVTRDGEIHSATSTGAPQ